MGLSCGLKRTRNSDSFGDRWSKKNGGVVGWREKMCDLET